MSRPITPERLAAMGYEWRRCGGLTRTDTGDIIHALKIALEALHDLYAYDLVRGHDRVALALAEIEGFYER